VNYVQVTGGATGNTPAISVQGSDSAQGLGIFSKGGSAVNFWTGGTNTTRALAIFGNSGNVVNGFTITPTLAGGSPSFAVAGTDTNIDLALTTKGTGALRFNTGGGEQVQVANKPSAINFLRINGNSTGAGPDIMARGGDAAVNLNLVAFGAGNIDFFTNHDSFVRQMRVANTASAVNFVQVTGAATGGATRISTQGSDANVGMDLVLKGTPFGPGFRVQNQGGTGTCFSVVVSTASVANHPRANPSAAGNPVSFSAEGSDTNIDLALTPKGTGNVRFGTFTADMTLIVQGFIEVKDSGGTIRKLAVIA
jgi:hypothetical protein